MAAQVLRQPALWIDSRTRRHLSEDYAFCHRWRGCGGKVWLDLVSSISHEGHACSNPTWRGAWHCWLAHGDFPGLPTEYWVTKLNIYDVQ